MTIFEKWWDLTEQTYALIWPEAIIGAVVVGLVWGFWKRRP